MEGADCFVPKGYVACRDCGEFMVAGSSRSRICEGCKAIRAQAVRVIEEALGTKPTPKRKRRARPMTEADRQRRRAWNAARSAALLRLAKIERATFEVIFAEEKAKRGLDPRVDAKGPESLVGADS